MVGYVLITLGSLACAKLAFDVTRMHLRVRAATVALEAQRRSIVDAWILATPVEELAKLVAAGHDLTEIVRKPPPPPQRLPINHDTLTYNGIPLEVLHARGVVFRTDLQWFSTSTSTVPSTTTAISNHKKPKKR